MMFGEIVAIFPIDLLEFNTINLMIILCTYCYYLVLLVYSTLTSRILREWFTYIATLVSVTSQPFFIQLV